MPNVEVQITPKTPVQVEIEMAGPRGVQGLQGLKGDQGIQGLKGDKGDPGEVTNASLAASLANYLPLAGGTLTGTLNSRSVIPTANATYALGSAASYFTNSYTTRQNFNATAYIDGTTAGQLGMVGQLVGPTGNVTTPSITFAGYTGYGFYFDTAQGMSFAQNGTQIAYFNGSGFNVNGNITSTTNGTRDLGGIGNYWRYLYSGRQYFNSTAYIDGATAGAMGVTGTMNFSGTSNFNGSVNVGQNSGSYARIDLNGGTAKLIYQAGGGGDNTVYLQAANAANNGNSELRFTGFNGNQGSLATINFASTVATGFIAARGAYDETTTTAGVYIGKAPDTSRILFATGTASQSWQIDNNAGVFRWFVPGAVKMQLDANGSLSSPNTFTVTSDGLFTTSNNTKDIGSATTYWRSIYGVRQYFNTTAYIDGANAGVMSFTGNLSLPTNLQTLGGPNAYFTFRTDNGSMIEARGNFFDVKTSYFRIQNATLETSGNFDSYNGGQWSKIALAADSVNTLRNAGDLIYRNRYWNGTSGADWEATIRHIQDSTTPTSHFSFRFNNVEKAAIDQAGNIQFYGLNLFGDAGNSTQSTPSTIGFNNFAQAGRAARFQFGDTSNALQNANSGAMQLYSYHRLELSGGSNNGAPSFFTGTKKGLALNAVQVMVDSRSDSLPVFGVQANSATQSGNLQNWYDSVGTILASMSAGGSFSLSGALTTTGIVSTGVSATVLATTYLHRVTASGATTQTLGTATNGRHLLIKNIGTGVVSLVGTIDGSTSYQLTAQYKYVWLIGNGSTWDVAGNN